jgi:hypothetical protein
VYCPAKRSRDRLRTAAGLAPGAPPSPWLRIPEDLAEPAELWPQQTTTAGWLTRRSARLAHSNARRVKPWGETRAVLQLLPFLHRICGWDFHCMEFLRIAFYFVDKTLLGNIARSL